MIYLDYTEATPVMYEVLESFNKVTKEFIASSNALHLYGLKSKSLLDNATKQICELLNIALDELNYTSGSLEANNIAIKGIANKYKNHGKHILVSRLEHNSIYEILNSLKSHGFEIEYLEHEQNGLVSFDDLKNKVRKDTILVIVSALNEDLGIRQPLKTIRQIIKKENSDTILHSDMSQAIGKVNVNLHDADSAAISAHKLYAPQGIGILYLNNNLKLESLIDDPKELPLPLIVAMSKALRIALADISRKEEHIKKLNNRLTNEILKLNNIVSNNTLYSIPHIINLSIKDIKPEIIVKALSDKEIYIGYKDDINDSIMALYHDENRARSSIRISISHITTIDEIDRFINNFYNVYEDLVNKE
jgi:cysteine desulfurase